MKIGVFTDSYLPYTSGVVRSIETFSNELNALGHQIYIFAPSYPGYKNENDGKIFRFMSIPAPTNPEFTLAVPFYPGLKETINRLNLDIIHVHSPFLMGRLGARYARHINVPLVFTFHTLYDKYVHYVPIGQSITRGITRKVCRDFCNRCDMVIVPTPATVNYLKELNVKSPVHCVPTGIKVEEFESADPGWLRRRYNIPENNTVLLFVGRLGLEKNIYFLLECLASVVNTNKAVKLVLVGNGPERENIQKRAEMMGIDSHIIFTGTLAKKDVCKAYAGADIFLFASVTETQGLVVGEAKAAGLPVVAVKAFGVSDMVKDGVDGYLTSQDKKEFTSKVRFLLDNPNVRREMGFLALKNAKKISSRNCALKLTEVYENLIKDKKTIPSKSSIVK